MRIAVDATAAVRQYAGVGRFARGLLSGLARLDAHNDYICITTGTPRLQLPPAAVPPRTSWVRLPVSERLRTILWQRLALPPGPARFAGNPALFFTPDYALPPVGRTPAVMTVHDLSFMIVPDCADARLRRYLTTVVPRSVRRADAVLAVSQTTADEVRDRLGVPADRIHVVPNGVDVGFRRPVGAADRRRIDAELRRRFGLQPGYVLSVSTLEPRKNYVRLLQAFARARRRLARERTGSAPSSPTLVIAGREGWLYEPIFHEVARLSLGTSVRFLTRVDDRDLELLYQAAAAFVYPSVYEGFGIPPLEAMASGVPVAASSGGALPEVLGDAALFFDPFDVEAMAGAVERVALDEALRDALIARGYRRAALYTWEGAAGAALTVFERVGRAGERRACSGGRSGDD